jgi:4-diphosphocytidyl-2-C-methyl-D-erythritol kinase
MVFFPHCKINLGLNILRKREDGFHELETVFYPLPVRDVLEAVRVQTEEVGFSQAGLSIPGDPAHNLCLKAYHLLKKDFPALPFVHIHLYKHIPIGAGLGGGSSDGAGMLRLLNSQFHLGLTTEQLMGYAAQLGSDCPFFIGDGPCLGKGRGERLEPLTLDLSAWSFLIVHPGIHISTARAFALCTPRGKGGSAHGAGKPLADIVAQPVASWAGQLVNDFEEPVFREYPSLRLIKEELYRRGAVYAALTGSGSSLFGIFEKGKAEAAGRAQDDGWDPTYAVIAVK